MSIETRNPDFPCLRPTHRDTLMDGIKILTSQNRSKMLTSNPAGMTKNPRSGRLTPGFLQSGTKGQVKGATMRMSSTTGLGVAEKQDELRQSFNHSASFSSSDSATLKNSTRSLRIASRANGFGVKFEVVNKSLMFVTRFYMVLYLFYEIVFGCLIENPITRRK